MNSDNEPADLVSISLGCLMGFFAICFILGVAGILKDLLA